MARGNRNYSDEFRERALELYKRVGLNEAARQTGLGKVTLLSWARQRGVEPESIAASVRQRNTRASLSAAARADREREELREELVARLGKVARVAAVRELELLAAGGFERSDLRSVSDARMKAIQQFELLEGRATSRMDYGQEQLLQGVALAFQTILPLIAEKAGQGFADEITARYAAALREARERVDAVEGEAEELDELPPGEEPAA